MLTGETRGAALARLGRALADPHLARALGELVDVVLAVDTDVDRVDSPARAEAVTR